MMSQRAAALLRHQICCVWNVEKKQQNITGYKKIYPEVSPCERLTANRRLLSYLRNLNAGRRHETQEATLVESGAADCSREQEEKEHAEKRKAENERERVAEVELRRVELKPAGGRKKEVQIQRG